MNGMKVVVTVNETYIYPLKVMLHSLFSTQKEPVEVFLIHSGLSSGQVGELRRFCTGYRQEFSEVQVENDVFEKAPVMGYFSKEMYYRILTPWLLPGEDRVLYLDPDIIVNDSLGSFFHMNLGKDAMAAVRDRPYAQIDHRKRLGLGEDAVYVNSGVILMDLKKMREKKSVEEVRRLLEERGKEMIFPDQDIINIMWEGYIRQMPDAYNLNPNILYLKEYLQMPMPQKARKMGKIVHYMGKSKPWNKGYMGGLYLFWGKAEWHVSPGRRAGILGRILLCPVRFVYGLYLFYRNHDWKGKRRRSA